ncbi:DinB family protein [Aureitalea marina]|nr:DinB family protein [Aureitalea marina]
MSFAEQLVHIQGNMQWLGSSHFGMTETAKAAAEDKKQIIIDKLEQSFTAVGSAVKAFPEDELAETVDFFAGPKSKLQMLNLLQDHLTHHRGQLVVYLNLNGIEPPRYSGW